VKPKLNPETTERICQLISAGSTYSGAYGQAGVAKRTFMEWMARGRAERAHQEGGGRARRVERQYLEFLLAVEQAELTAKAVLVTAWMKAATGSKTRPPDWRAARDFLARRWPDEWMPREGRQLTGGDGGPIEVSSTTRVEGVFDIRDDAQRTAEVLATLVEAGILPPETAKVLKWVPEPDEEAAGAEPEHEGESEPGDG
jgi:hypothetical protein